MPTSPNRSSGSTPIRGTGKSSTRRPRAYSSEDEDASYSDEDDYSWSSEELSPKSAPNKTNNKKQSSKPRRARKVAPMTDKRGGGARRGGGEAPPQVTTLFGVSFVGLRKFFVTHEHVHHGDFDGAMASMALMCTLLLLVPFHVVTSLGYVYLDDLTAHATACHGEAGVTYERIYFGYRAILLITVYSCLCGMILSLFYFLFKRTDPLEYRIWHPKARALAILVFFFTSFALCGIITLLNWLFDYYLLGTEANLCNNNTSVWVFPGLLAAGLVYFVGFFLIL